jgi:hypothetical protein
MNNIFTTTSVGNSDQTEINTKYYNNQKYEIDIIFSNGQENIVKLNVASLVSLEIEEDSREWYKKAVLTINNPKNVFEYRRTPSTPVNQYYKFRNDGRDFVYVEIKPIQDSTVKFPSVNIDYNVWGMKYLFVVYDKKEILVGDTTNQKQLRLYLWEYDYQIMSEINLDWSTNRILSNKILPSQATDEEKKVYTGLAIKSLITTALDGYSTPAFAPDWNIGSSKIFYSSFATNNAIDDLNYLLKKHVSSQSGADGGLDPCLLSRSRYTQVWSLRSFTDIFSKAVTKGSAGELQREILTLTSQSGADEGNEEALFSLPVSPFSSSTYKNTNYRDPVRSLITNIHFVDMSALDSTHEMISTPCYSNNLKDKIIELDFVSNDIEKVKKYISDNYSQKFKIFSKPDTLLTLNKVKTQARAVNTVYSYSGDKIARLADSRNLMLYSAIFLNTSLNITVPGSPIRQATSFISIEESKPGSRDEFKNKLLGQWFVYKVIHKFTADDYSNNITAVRVHANDNIGIKDDIS